MFTLFQKKKIEQYNEEHNANASTETGEVELWIVEWTARNGEFSSNRFRVSKGFINENLAKAFAKELRDAQALLKSTEDLNIRTYKQQ